MIDGSVAAPFWPVARAFERQLEASGGGAAVCVYYQGHKVVDLWGGVRDEVGRPWREDTLSMSFSTSKGVMSTLLNILADRGAFAYDDPISAHWPEFGAGGKSSITVRHLMTHRAGLSRLRPLLDRGDRILDWDYMVDALARAEARPTPHSAYHALTYGWLAGELIQRVTGRTLIDVIRDELEEPLGLDGIHIGAPPEAIARTAQLSARPGSKPRSPMALLFSDRLASAGSVGSLARRSTGNICWTRSFRPTTRRRSSTSASSRCPCPPRMGSSPRAPSRACTPRSRRVGRSMAFDC
jgi:CubicO group peptidase (beta-lactamase class C family)